jgi:WD40 repeat protein
LRQRRTNRRLRVLLAGVAVFLAVALVAGALAVVQRGNARRSAERAATAARVALAQSLGAKAVIEPHLDLAMLEAREAMNLDVSLDTRDDLLTTLARSPRAIGKLYGDGNRILQVAVSPDGRTLAIGHNDESATFVDAVTDRRLGHVAFPNLQAFVFTPDGKYALTPKPDSGFHFTSLELYDAHTFRLVRTIPTPPSVRAVRAFAFAFAFSADGSRFAFSSSPEVTHGGHTVIVQWDPSTWAPVGPIIASPYTVDYLAYAGDAGHLVVTTTGKTTLFDARTGRTIRRYPLGSFPAALSPDGRTLVFGKTTGEVDFADLTTGKVTAGVGGHTAPVQSVAITPDGRTAATAGDDRKVVLWDIASHAVIDTLTGHAARIPTLAISNDGSTLYSGSLDGSVLVWDLKGDRRFGRTFTASAGDDGAFGPTPNVAFSPDGKVMATGETNGNVDLIDPVTLRRVSSFAAIPGDQITNVEFASNDAVVVGGDRPGPNNTVVGAVVMWRLAPTPTLTRTLSGMQGVTWVAASPDGRTIVGAGTDPNYSNGRIALWNAATGALRVPPFELKHGVYQAVIARDGRTVAAVFDDGSAAVIDAVAHHVERQWKAAVVPPGLTVALSPDGRTMATGAWDGHLGMWDVRTGKALHQPVKAADGPLASVGWSPDGRTILTGGFDGTTRLFDVATGRQVGLFPGLNDQWEFARFSPDASTVAVVYSNGQGFLWPASLRAWEDHACAVAHRVFTRQEWSQLVPGHPYQPVCTG